MLIEILILQTFTFSNSGWPIAQKNAGSLGSTGGKNGGKLRLAYDSYLQQLTSKIDLQGAQTLLIWAADRVPYRWRWLTNSRRLWR